MPGCQRNCMWNAGFAGGYFHGNHVQTFSTACKILFILRKPEILFWGENYAWSVTLESGYSFLNGAACFAAVLALVREVFYRIVLIHSPRTPFNHLRSLKESFGITHWFLCHGIIQPCF